MSPEEIIQTFEVLAPEVEARAANDAAIIGNAQRSLGPLAAAVASPDNQTHGLANYTYNRTLRPRVDQMRDAMIVQGLNMGLNRELQNRMTAAQLAQQRAQQRYGSSGGGGASGGGSGAANGTITGVEEIDTGNGMASVSSLPLQNVPNGTGSIRSTVISQDGKPMVLIENNSNQPYTFNGVTIQPGGSHSFRTDGNTNVSSPGSGSGGGGGGGGGR